DDELKKYPSLSFYRQGEFIDLCRGPHLPHAGKVGAFKLLSIAGAYWKNDATRKQLQRLYATAFFSQKELDEYLRLVEEAKKREGEMHAVLKQAHFVPPGYDAAATQAAKLEAVHQYALKLLGVLQVELPEYHAAKDAQDRAEALLKWLTDQEGFLLKPMN